jgi:hypothetical protein
MSCAFLQHRKNNVILIKMAFERYIMQFLHDSFFSRKKITSNLLYQKSISVL